MSDTFEAKNRRIAEILSLQRTSTTEIQHLLAEEAKRPWPTEHEPPPVPGTIARSAAEALMRRAGYRFQCGVYDAEESADHASQPVVAIMKLAGDGYICACERHLADWKRLPPSSFGRTFDHVVEDAVKSEGEVRR